MAESNTLESVCDHDSSYDELTWLADCKWLVRCVSCGRLLVLHHTETDAVDVDGVATIVWREA